MRMLTTVRQRDLSLASDYNVVLLRVAVWSALGLVAVSFFVRGLLPRLTFLQVLSDADLSPVSISIKGIQLALPVKTVFSNAIFHIVFPLAAAVAGRIFKLHDRISDLLGTRQIFDIDEILVPLLGGAGVRVTVDSKRKMHTHRHRLMRNCFYRYASAWTKAPDEERIDSHLAQEALDCWAAYWVVLELAFWGSCLFVVCAMMRLYRDAMHAAIISGGLWVVFALHRGRTAPLAHRQVEAILEDASRRTQIGASANEILG